MEEKVSLEGLVVVEVIGPDGEVKDHEEIHNLVTTVGDQYYAERGANKASPTQAAVVGMKLGTGVTAASKSGAGAAIGTYITGSYKAFDATYPQANAVAGTDTGWTSDYQVTWPAGTVTNAAITEVTLTNSSVDAAGTAAEVVSRATFAAKNKTSADQLVITWKHKMLGA